MGRSTLDAASFEDHTKKFHSHFINKTISADEQFFFLDFRMIVLGLNCFHGDSSAALIHDGKLIAAAEEERFRRVKHWAGWNQS